MISKIAKQTVEKWQSEGLKPSFEDTIHLNALGLKVERGNDVYDFSALPRVAFLNNICIYEPTVAKKLWMDKAYQLIADNIQTQLFFTAYALYCDELPSLNDIDKLIQQVLKFSEEHLFDLTETQIYSAIDYVINGNDPNADEEFIANENEKKFDCYTVPDTVQSAAQQIALQAMQCGIDIKAIDFTTVPVLERMITVAVMQKGADWIKNERAQNAAKFMIEANKIEKRLKADKETEDNKDIDNGKR